MRESATAVNRAEKDDAGKIEQGVGGARHNGKENSAPLPRPKESEGCAKKRKEVNDAARGILHRPRHSIAHGVILART